MKEYDPARVNSKKAVSKFLSTVSKTLDLPVESLPEVLDPMISFVCKNLPASTFEDQSPSDVLESFLDALAQGIYLKK